jgi:Primase C terminal 1 (PriCT-1)
MRHRGMEEGEIATALLAVNEGRCEPPLDEAEVRQVAKSVTRYAPGRPKCQNANNVKADSPPSEATDALGSLLGLDTVGLQVEGVVLFGRGSGAVAWIHLSDGTKITLDTLGKFTSGPKLAIEVALQAGATPALKPADVTRVMALLHRLAEHHEVLDQENRAADLGIAYMQTVRTIAVRMDDQHERWRAFELLDRTDPVSRARANGISIAETSIVLEDATAGVRYVRASWFAAYLRQQAGPGAAEEGVRAMKRLGWNKPGTEGRVKATAPGRPATLQWAFFQVPAGWEQR